MPMLFKGNLHQPCDYITNVIKPHMTDGVRVMSLSTTLKHKTSVAKDCLWQTVFH